jgi:DNA-binding NarL/FixJ family response regulator
VNAPERGQAEIEAEIRALEARLAQLREELDGVAAERPASTADGPLQVLIADDDPVMREFLQTVIESQSDLAFAGVAADTQEAIELARASKPDVVVLDLSMPGGGGIVAAIEIARESPATKIVAFTSLDDLQSQTEFMRAGAVSYLVKGASPDEVVSTIRQAVRW